MVKNIFLVCLLYIVGCPSSKTPGQAPRPQHPFNQQDNQQHNENADNGKVPPQINFAASHYNFRAGWDIKAVAPTNAGGKISECKIVEGHLPEGMILSSSDCTLSGRPTWPSRQTITLEAQNESGSSKKVLDIFVLPAANIAVGYDNACFLTQGHEVYCAGNVSGGAGTHGIPHKIHGLDNLNVVALFAAWNNNCALTDSGDLYCWGKNIVPERNREDDLPLTQLPYENVLSVGMGVRFSCLTDTLGNVKCWGANLSGELGAGEGSDREAQLLASSFSSMPVLPAVGFDGISGVLTAGGEFYDWGYINGVRQVPTVINGISHAPIALSSQQDGFWFLMADGSVDYLDSENHWQKKKHSNVKALAASTYGKKSCFILEGSRVSCEGIRLSSPSEKFESPVTSIAVGDSAVCVALENGEVYCAGENKNGLFGMNRGDGTKYNTFQKSTINLRTGHIDQNN